MNIIFNNIAVTINGNTITTSDVTVNVPDIIDRDALNNVIKGITDTQLAIDLAHSIKADLTD